MFHNNLNGADEEAAKRRAEHYADRAKKTSIKRALITVVITVGIVFLVLYGLDYLGIL
ncbi:hypothetical protein [Saccharibacillus alkalitolerans]|uniref:Uncharacterized protein n=1 Tax=Saccharibacillus alkalitolerans TaxID=2705290 RepID=A0ABX0F5V4_9BACL|nr:hypothetical protein [Saccharibacillus alkalitolerans]NGZ76328.1 hypothetical protein [Saccharibacillus alkalitolerans]